MQKIMYENVFTAKGKLFVRTFNPDSKESSTTGVNYVPPVFMKSSEKTDLKSPITKEYLKKIQFSSDKEYKDSLNLYKSSGVTLYGNKSKEFSFISEKWPVPTESDHSFHTIFIDIETMVDLSDPNHNKTLDWKAYGSERSATAIISSIQMYDTKSKEFYIFGLAKDWENKTNFVSPHGKINYWNMSTEENMLKAFLGLLNRRNPTLLVGYNSIGYDYPYLTNRIIRVLDKRNDLYIKNQQGTYSFNKETLNGEYVKQLSPVGLVKHREIQTNYGTQDAFQWVGYFLDDFKELYGKYTYTTLTSYSLNAVAEHELGSNKVNHDDFSDFGEFYREDFSKFILYGVQDVALLVELEDKLKLIELAKMIAYTCGVNYSDVSGTVKQWNSYMYNEYMSKGYVLPLEQFYSGEDTVLLDYIMENKEIQKEISDEKMEHYNKCYNTLDDEGNSSYKSQRFPGGVTRGTAKFWKSVCSFDFGSLYPSVIQWANIGMETLILPKDLPKELLDLRAKYAIFYPKFENSKNLIKYDFQYMETVQRNKEVIDEMNTVLKKHNVVMTPNGMFFRKDERSIISQQMESIINKRKVHKKQMKTYEQQIEDLKSEKSKLLEMLENA